MVSSHWAVCPHGRAGFVALVLVNAPLSLSPQAAFPVRHRPDPSTSRARRSVSSRRGRAHLRLGREQQAGRAESVHRSLGRGLVHVRRPCHSGVRLLPVAGPFFLDSEDLGQKLRGGTAHALLAHWSPVPSWLARWRYPDPHVFFRPRLCPSSGGVLIVLTAPSPLRAVCPDRTSGAVHRACVGPLHASWEPAEVDHDVRLGRNPREPKPLASFSRLCVVGDEEGMSQRARWNHRFGTAALQFPVWRCRA